MDVYKYIQQSSYFSWVKKTLTKINSIFLAYKCQSPFRIFNPLFSGYSLVGMNIIYC